MEGYEKMKRALVFLIMLNLLTTGCVSRTVAQAGKGKISQPVPVSQAHPLDQEEKEPDYVPPIPDGEWKLLLVNDRNTISEDFEPALEEVQGVYRMDARVASIMRQMIADAKSQGVDLLVCSAYRPYSSQQRNFEASVTRYMQAGYSREQAETQTLRLIAAPGSSEHQTGLAADIVTPAYQSLDNGYADTAAARWLKANAASYGFILRYPADKQDITHIDFEPWHYRYVGEEAAKVIMEKGICLEEYLGQ